MKRPAACSKQRPSACTMKKLPKPKRSRSKAALQRKRNRDKNLVWRTRRAQKDGKEINPHIPRNRTIAARVIQMEKKHRHLEKKQNDLEEKHLVLEQEQTRCISLTEKANHDFCRVQDHSLEAQAMAEQALHQGSTNGDEMKRMRLIQDQQQSRLIAFEGYLQDNAVQLSKHSALPLSTNQTSPVLKTPEKPPKPRKVSSRVSITNWPSREQGDVDSIHQTTTEALQKDTDVLQQHTANQHRLNQKSLKILQPSRLTSQCRSPSSESREESPPCNITTTLASS